MGNYRSRLMALWCPYVSPVLLWSVMLYADRISVTFDTGYLAYTGQNISDSDVGKRIPSQLTYSKRRPRFTRGDGRTVHQQPPDLTKTATMGLSPPALDPSEERPRSAIEAAESPTRDLQSIANVHSMLESAVSPNDRSRG